MNVSIDDLRLRTVLLAALLAVAGLAVPSEEASAQFENKAMAIGSLHHVYNEVGGETEYWWTGYGLEWPAHRQYRGTIRANVFWVSRTNFTGPDGEDFPVQIAHVGGRATGFGEFFPQNFETVSRFEHTDVLVDGLPSIRKVADVDRVNPDMKYDRMIVDKVNAINGITVTRRIYAYSQEDHDNYHIQSYTLTNTGNTDDDPDIELPDQTATGVYLHRGNRYGYGNFYIPGNEWGANVMNDVVGDGVRQYDTDLRARYTWLGNSPGAEMDPLGSPVITDDHWFTQEGDDARLIQPQIVGSATVHAPAEPGGPDADNVNSTSPDELQPSVTGYIGADHGLMSANDPYNVPKMQREFQMLSGGWGAEGHHGHMDPHHADVVDDDGDFTTVRGEGDPKLADSGGQQDFYSYGPYTLEPGESVTIVDVQGVDGLNRQESIWVGEGFKQAIEETGDKWTRQKFSIPSRPNTELNKNEWVMSGVDSLFQTFQRAIAGWESESGPPRPPLPPARFEVTSGVGSINLSWTPQDGGPERSAWEVYRTTTEWEGDADNDYQYQKVATLDPSATSYEDTNVQRGLNYYYHIKAVGTEAANDGSVMTRPGKLRSNRHYTQTYTAASLKRPPGTLDEASIVPNPYVISGQEGVSWPEENRLAFLDIPGQATIKIFTEMGELVKTIEHTDGSGDDFWRLQTEDRQIITTGVYIAVITNNKTGEQEIEKFSVIR